MIQGVKLGRLLEQHINGGTGVAGFGGELRSLLGIVEGGGECGEDTFDKKQQAISAKDFDFAEVAAHFLGSNVKGRLPTITRELQQLTMFRGIGEAEGFVVLPSHFQNISAFSATVTGLLDAMILEAYQDPQFMADQLFETVDVRTNGGKSIGVLNDGQYGDLLLDGEAYPTVGLKETYVSRPENERRGNVIQLNIKDLIYDRTDMIQAKAVNASYAVRRGKEIRMADTFLGVSNTYSRDGSTSNTYLDARGTNPNDYLNSSVNTLGQFQDIDEAVQILEGNTDPGTGFEIEIGEPYDVAVMPQQWLELQTIARATEVETRIGTDPLQIRRSQNPLYSINPIRLSRLFYNRMLLATANASYSANRWFMGKFKRAFRYLQLIPFQSNEAPLSSEDVRRDIVLIRVAMEHGVPMIVEPRYAYMGTEEDITP